jgi:hypothetical protein
LCVIGKSYCLLGLPRRDATGGASGVLGSSCQRYDTDCSANPTCECLCSHGYGCQTNCTCSGSKGFPTISCEAI